MLDLYPTPIGGRHVWLDGSDDPAAPVLIACHGTAQKLTGGGYLDFTEHTRRFGTLRSQWLFAYVKSAGWAWRQKKDREHVAAVVRYFAAQTRPVFIAGFSGGGWPVHWALADVSEHIAGAILHSAPAPREKLQGRHPVPILAVVCRHERLPWRFIAMLPISIIAGPTNNQWYKDIVAVYRQAGHVVRPEVAIDCEHHRWWHEQNQSMLELITLLAKRKEAA